MKQIESQSGTNGFKSKKDKSLLHFAALRGLYEVNKILLEQKVDKNSKNEDVTTPLHLADKHGSTPLLLAVSYGLSKICKILLEDMVEKIHFTSLE